MKFAPLICVAATLLCCLPSVGAAQGCGGRSGRGGRGGGGATGVRCMPPVRGLSLGEAQKVVSSRTGLECGAKHLQGGNPSPSDSVVRQFPPENQPIPVATVCTLYVMPHAAPQVPLTPSVVPQTPDSTPAPKPRATSDKKPSRQIPARGVLVPKFTGQRIGRALNLPGAESLRVVTRYAERSRTARDSIVIAQSIPQRTRVAAGTEVVLTVSQRETVRMLRLTIVPESISVHPGDTVRMTAIAHMSDSTRSQVAATWRVSTGSITPDGSFIAGPSMSHVVVAASQGGQTATAVIRVDTPPPLWLIALIAAGVGLVGAFGWVLFHRPPPPPSPPPPSPPPLAFTYDYNLPAPETEIATSGGHGPDLALVSYAGESEHTIEPRGDKLFDEEKSYG